MKLTLRDRLEIVRRVKAMVKLAKQVGSARERIRQINGTPDPKMLKPLDEAHERFIDFLEEL